MVPVDEEAEPVELAEPVGLEVVLLVLLLLHAARAQGWQPARRSRPPP